jgi:outer membrane protein OmpA-like peptidoglycan-associated protein
MHFNIHTINKRRINSMKHHATAALLIALAMLIALPLFGQFKDQGVGVGVQGGVTVGATEYSADKTDLFLRAYFRHPILGSRLLGEFGLGMGRVTGESKNYSTEIIPIDYRLILSPLAAETFNPYLYGGFGALHYEVKDPGFPYTPGLKTSTWTAVIPVGLGLALRISENVALELSGGLNMTWTKGLNAYEPTKNDNYYTGLVGFSWIGESGSADPDKDGLTNKEEKTFGTDKKNPDTDGDGLNDGDEVKKYTTNPLKADTDGDGLSDGDEVLKYKTDPLKADTDGDGVSDGDEILKYKTDPLKTDTDGDGLSDGDEVLKYKTDPLKADTDGDGLKDGDEVNKYKSDPLKADTDGGTVNDGVEVTRGTNPLDPADDVPKPKVEVGQTAVLEGITFASGKATIQPGSEATLEAAYEALKKFPETTWEIQGHTDNTGKKATNVKLSQARADAVKAWFVAKGIDASRLTAKGYGPDKPLTPNKTAEDKAKNRRIEYMRTK